MAQREDPLRAKISLPIGERESIRAFSDITREWKIAAEQPRDAREMHWYSTCSVADYNIIRKMLHDKRRPTLSGCTGVVMRDGKRVYVLYVRLHPDRIQ